MRRGPLAGNYPASAAMVMLALIPYLALSAALAPITPLIAGQLHMSLQAMSLALGMANAAYAVGTVLAVLFAQLLPQRRMMVLYAAVLVTASVLAAAASAPWMFIAGHVLQGLCTSLLLIAALPPLVVGQAPSKLRPTAMVLNFVIFGAVALGPLIGGVQASAHAWRPLFWIIAGIASGALMLALWTFEDTPPADPGAPRDILAVALAASGCAAAFYGASELLTHPFLGASTFVPLVGGLGLIVALLVYQYQAKNPLLTIRGLVSTIPVAGIIVAMCAAATSVSAIALTSIVLQHRVTPLHLGLYLLPEVAGAALTAVLLGVVLRTRGIHYLVLGGMIALGAGILVISRLIPPTETLTLIGSGLIGVGVGGSVAPALFVTGFSVAASNLQRVFAIVELLRGVAAFMIAPILVHFAATVGGRGITGTSTAMWICFGIAIGGAALGVCLYLLGGVRPEAPAIDRWFASQAPDAAGPPQAALKSPPLLARIRKRYSERPLREPGVATSADHDGRLAASLRRESGAVTPGGTGPVLFAYDGSELSTLAIHEARQQLAPGRDALVLTVWEPFNVGFLPADEIKFDAADAYEVRRAAERMAAHGASLANAAGFRAQGITTRATPTWKGVVDVADDRDASLIVLGSHGRTRLASVVRGSVASGVADHSQRSVLIVHRKSAGRAANSAAVPSRGTR